ncbi:MAG: hypothetical protein AAGJ80_02605 [Cyanobacteria bacterium J06553_1]
MLEPADLRALAIEQAFSEEEDRDLIGTYTHSITLGTNRGKSPEVKDIGSGYQQPYMEENRQDHSSVCL